MKVIELSSLLSFSFIRFSFYLKKKKKKINWAQICIGSQNETKFLKEAYVLNARWRGVTHLNFIRNRMLLENRRLIFHNKEWKSFDKVNFLGTPLRFWVILGDLIPQNCTKARWDQIIVVLSRWYSIHIYFQGYWIWFSEFWFDFSGTTNEGWSQVIVNFSRY